MITELDSLTIALLVILALFFGSMLLIAAVLKFNRFSRELHYINMEINRNTGTEQKYWQREKRRLWLSLLPFCRR